MKDGKQDDLPFMLSRLQDALSGLGSTNKSGKRKRRADALAYVRETFKGATNEEFVTILLRVIQNLDEQGPLMKKVARLLQIAIDEGRIDSILVLLAMVLGMLMHEGEWAPLLKAGRKISDAGYMSGTERGTRNAARDRKMAREMEDRTTRHPLKSETAHIQDVGKKYGLGKSAARAAIMRGREHLKK
jgi:hypothetical protein